MKKALLIFIMMSLYPSQIVPMYANDFSLEDFITAVKSGDIKRLEEYVRPDTRIPYSNAFRMKVRDKKEITGNEITKYLKQCCESWKKSPDFITAKKGEMKILISTYSGYEQDIISFKKKADKLVITGIVHNVPGN